MGFTFNDALSLLMIFSGRLKLAAQCLARIGLSSAPGNTVPLAGVSTTTQSAHAFLDPRIGIRRVGRVHTWGDDRETDLGRATKAQARCPRVASLAVLQTKGSPQNFRMLRTTSASPVAAGAGCSTRVLVRGARAYSGRCTRASSVYRPSLL